MIVRGEDIQRRNVVVVLVTRTIYHGIAVVSFIVWQFIQSPFILGSLVSLPDPFGGKRSSDNDGKFYLIATIYFYDVTFLESNLFCVSASEGLVRMTVVCRQIADSGIVNAETRTAVRPVDQFSFPIIHPFRKTFAVVVQQSHWNLRDIIAEGIQRIVVFLLHLLAVKDILVHQSLCLLQSCGEGLRTIGIHLIFRIM